MINNKLKIKIITVLLDYLELLSVSDNIKIINNILSIYDSRLLMDYMLDMLVMNDISKKTFKEIIKILEDNT